MVEKKTAGNKTKLERILKEKPDHALMEKDLSTILSIVFFMSEKKTDDSKTKLAHVLKTL